MSDDQVIIIYKSLKNLIDTMEAMQECGSHIIGYRMMLNTITNIIGYRRMMLNTITNINNKNTRKL